MNFSGHTLIIPEKADAERESVGDIWKQRGGMVLRLGKFWAPPDLEPKSVRVYGNDTFCQILAQKLKLRLVSPADDLLAEVPERFLRRELRSESLEAALQNSFPIFVKSQAPKIFKAKIYQSSEELSQECKNLSLDTPVFISEIVDIISEARCFVLNGQVLGCAVYEGEEDRASVVDFVHSLSKELRLPDTCVVDVGSVAKRGLAVIEFNASWGAGLNGCDPSQVILAIEAATRPGT